MRPTGVAPGGTSRDRIFPSTLERDEIPTSRNRVLRCKKSDLDKKAAALAVRWYKDFQLDFSNARLDAATRDDESYTNDTSLVTAHRKRFWDTSMFRAIKYATRRETFLCYPDDEGNHGKGMFCSMFVAICYQAAGIKDWVRPMNPRDPKTRVSDKKMTWVELEQVQHFQHARTETNRMHIDFFGYSEWEFYQGHLAKLRPKDYQPKVLPGVTLVPSVLYWDFVINPSIRSVPWHVQITKGMMLDSKTIMPRGMFHCLLADKEGWAGYGRSDWRKGQ